jgi:predicted ATPase
MELARLWQGQGRKADARAALKTIHDRFTEGFHTSDLRAAKLLLDTLR